MSVGWFIIGSIYLIRFIVNSTEEDTTVRSKANEVDVQKPIEFISNGLVVNKSLSRYYIAILELQNERTIYIQKINERYNRQLNFVKEDILLGYKVAENRAELESARVYMLDLCNYMGNLS